MTYGVYYRRADGKGTQLYLAGLKGFEAANIKQQVFDRDPRKTMCWVLDETGQMLGDALTRDPDEAETDRVMRAT